MSKTSFYIQIDGEKVPVSEEVYRAFKRPAWTEHKRRMVRAKHELSFEVFVEGGFDIPADDPLVEEIVTDRLQLDMLMSALSSLTADERNLIDALFFKGKSEREVASESGISQQAVHKKKRRILEKLKHLLVS